VVVEVSDDVAAEDLAEDTVWAQMENASAPTVDIENLIN
jgi:hypothetical protein